MHTYKDYMVYWDGCGGEKNKFTTVDAGGGTAGKQTKWEWSKSSGMLGWKSTSHTGMTYKNQHLQEPSLLPHDLPPS